MSWYKFYKTRLNALFTAIVVYLLIEVLLFREYIVYVIQFCNAVNLWWDNLENFFISHPYFPFIKAIFDRCLLFTFLFVVFWGVDHIHNDMNSLPENKKIK